MDAFIAAVVKATMPNGGELSPAQLKQARQMWQMLDNMSDSNPEEYAEFIKQQMKAMTREMPELLQKKQKPTTDPPIVLRARIAAPATAAKTASAAEPVRVDRIVQPRNAAAEPAHAVILLYERAEAVAAVHNGSVWRAADGCEALRQSSIPLQVSRPAQTS